MTTNARARRREMCAVSVDPFKEARRFLAQMPEEVFQLWLDDRIRSNGWPPRGIEWDGFLFGQPVELWQRLKWNKQALSLMPQNLGPKSIDLAIQMIDANVHGKRNFLSSYIPDTRQRFDRLVAFIKKEGVLPAPLVLLHTAEGYEVAEGNHRIGAMIAAAARRGKPGFFPSEVEAWVGSIDG